MNKSFLLILILLCSVFYCNAQSIETSPFLNIPISLRLYPHQKYRSKNELKPKNTAPCDSLLDEAPIDFNLKIDYFRLSDGSIAAFFTSQIENKELGFEITNQTQRSSVEIFGRITSADKKIDGTFADVVVFSANNAGSKVTAFSDKQTYVKGVILPSGSYTIMFLLVLRDSAKCNTGVQFKKFTIPNL